MISKRDISKLEGLLYLYALSQSNSKREVSEELGTSIDTINKYVSDLESELKTKLLMSNGRGTVITPEGQKVLRVSENIIKSIKELGGYRKDAASFKGIVRIAMTEAIVEYLGTKELLEFFEQYPELQIQNQINNKMPNMGTLEADICIGYEAPTNPNLVLMGVKEIKCGIYASQKYIEKYGEPKDIEDMLANHRICNKDSHELYVPYWKELMEKAQHIVYQSNSVFSLREAISSGIGIGISTKIYGAANLVEIKNIDFDFEIKIYIISHLETKDKPKVRLVAEFIKKLLDIRSKQTE